MTETLAELEQDSTRSRILAFEKEGVIAGAVRERQEKDSCLIGRLIVAPEEQNQGIGKALMQDIEAAHSGARRFELFTGNRSSKNLALYHALGYVPFRQETLGKITLVFLKN